jgi:hypothetical protein
MSYTISSKTSSYDNSKKTPSDSGVSSLTDDNYNSSGTETYVIAKIFKDENNKKCVEAKRTYPNDNGKLDRLIDAISSGIDAYNIEEPPNIEMFVNSTKQTFDKNSPTPFSRSNLLQVESDGINPSSTSRNSYTATNSGSIENETPNIEESELISDTDLKELKEMYTGHESYFILNKDGPTKFDDVKTAVALKRKRDNINFQYYNPTYPVWNWHDSCRWLLDHPQKSGQNYLVIITPKEAKTLKDDTEIYNELADYKKNKVDEINRYTIEEYTNYIIKIINSGNTIAIDFIKDRLNNNEYKDSVNVEALKYTIKNINTSQALSQTPEDILNIIIDPNMTKQQKTQIVNSDLTKLVDAIDRLQKIYINMEDEINQYYKTDHFILLNDTDKETKKNSNKIQLEDIKKNIIQNMVIIAENLNLKRAISLLMSTLINKDYRILIAHNLSSEIKEEIYLNKQTYQQLDQNIQKEIKEYISDEKKRIPLMKRIGRTLGLGGGTKKKKGLSNLSTKGGRSKMNKNRKTNKRIKLHKTRSRK